MTKKNTPNIAIVHDYLNQQGGAEYVVSVLHEMFPEAPIYTSIYNAEKMWDPLKTAKIKTSWMQYLPGIKKHYKKYIFLYPLAFRSMNLKKFDMIISSCSGFAKGIRVSKSQKHFCYLHTPPRFLYRSQEYLKKENIPLFFKWLLPPLLKLLKKWDLATNHTVTHFIANSKNVEARIQKFYNRSSTVIYPPVDLSRFPLSTISDDYFLIISRLIGYKRIDIAINAFNQTEQKLIIIGTGPDMNRLQRLAKSNIKFLGYQPNIVVEEMIKGCRALIFPGEEDFGITPVEAQSAGKPVIAYHAGGALETLIENETGIFFNQPTPESLMNALERFKTIKFDAKRIHDHAQQFSKERFISEIKKLILNTQ